MGPSTTQVRCDLGVLFVHGIGSQERGETVTAWGDALLDWLSAWLGHGAGHEPDPNSIQMLEPGPVRPVGAQLRTEGSAPPYIDVEIELPPASGTGTNPPQRWRLAESWWAQAFQPPGFRELAFWGFTVLPWALVTHFVTRLERAWRSSRSLASTFTPLRVVALGWRLAAEFVLVLVALVVSPILAALVLVMLVLAALPLRTLRDAAVKIQQLLSRTVGDSYVLLGSTTRRRSIISQIERDLAALADCRGLVVVAHSQGAAIAYEALRQVQPANLRRFITFGSGQTKLLALRQLARSGAHRLVWLAPLALATLAFTVWFGIDRYRSTGDDAAWVLVYVAGVIAILVSGLAAARDPVAPNEAAFDIGADHGWLDLYASHDPVPNGPLFGIHHDQEARFESREVHNGASPLGDHTSYWRNGDEFVPAVAAAVAAAAGGSIDQPQGLDAEHRRLALARRRWRLRCLRGLRWLAVGTLALLLVVHGDLSPIGRRVLEVWAWLVDLVPLVTWRPDGLSAAGTVHPLIGVASLGLAVALGYLALVGLWRLWERADHLRFVSRQGYLLWPAEFVAGVLTVIGLVAVTWAAPSLPPPTIDLDWLIGLFLAPIGLPLVVIMVLALTSPLGWLLLRVGVIRRGHFPPSVGEIAAIVAPWYIVVLALEALPGVPAGGLVILVALLGTPVFAVLGLPLVTSSRRLRRLLQPLERLAAAEPVPLAVLTASDDDTVLAAARHLRDAIDTATEALRARLVTQTDSDAPPPVERRLLTPTLSGARLQRHLGGLTDQAERFASVAHAQGYVDDARTVLNAAAATSPSAAVRLWELAPSATARRYLEAHARCGQLVTRQRIRRLL
jgi:hypothetical protein